MNKVFYIVTLSLLVTIVGCKQEINSNKLHFSTSAEYPPFEYVEHGELKGFDIDLARLVAKELGKEAVFDNMQFSTVLPAVSSGQTDLAIATITITEERKKNFDFSKPYYFEGMAAVYRANQPIKNRSQLQGKKIAAQLGSVMEIWLHQNAPKNEITALDNNNQAIEALIAGHVDVVLMDGVQGAVFSKINNSLSYAIIAKDNAGYALVLKKNSPLTITINRALDKLSASGKITQLENKWLKAAD